MPRSKGRLESEVQAGIIAYLNTRPDIFFWRQNSGVVKEGKRFVRFGVPGISDILAVQAPSGRLVAIEVKREVGGVLSKDQQWWGGQVEAHGGKYVVASRLEDVVEALGEPVARIVKAERRKRVIAR